MTIITTTKIDGESTAVSANLRKVRTFSVPFDIKSLKPTTKFTFWCNGVDMSWSCQQYGKRLGDDLISDITGRLKFTFLGEMNNEVVIYSDTTSKNHQFLLKDISGTISAISMIPQVISVRK